jgi:hypothetical protein
MGSDPVMSIYTVQCKRCLGWFTPLGFLKHKVCRRPTPQKIEVTEAMKEAGAKVLHKYDGLELTELAERVFNVMIEAMGK